MMQIQYYRGMLVQENDEKMKTTSPKSKSQKGDIFLNTFRNKNLWGMERISPIKSESGANIPIYTNLTFRKSPSNERLGFRLAPTEH